MQIARPLARAGFAAVLLASLPAAAPAGASPPCAGGLDLRLSAPRATQGEILLAELHHAAPLAEVTGELAGVRVPFWPDASAAGGTASFHALLGIDLERAAGAYDFTVTARTPAGDTLHCAAQVVVAKGKFRIERLRLPRRFVELNQEDLERSQREASRLLDLYSQVTPQRLWQGSFLEPVTGVAGSGNFGRRRILNGQPRSPHSGEDFPAPAGAPVHAAQRGRVVLAEELFFAGNAVLLDHGLGLYTFYAHLESIAVRTGDMVEAGQQIGTVGATGRVTGAHLHWAARLLRARISPVLLLSLPLPPV